MKILLYALCAVIGYLLGNFSSGLIIARRMGNIDIRDYGSGNAGTTNVLRTLGWLPSVLTLLGDALKGVLAALIGKWIGGEAGMLVGGLFAVVGHNWPALFHFRGGKGMATTLGVVIVAHHALALALFLPWLVIVALTRYVSVASLAMCVIYPIITAILFHARPLGWLHILVFSLIGLMGIFGHRANIQRLIRREENRLDFRKISEISKKK